VSDLVDVVALEPWLGERGLLCGVGPLTVEPLGEGHSNLTFLLSRGAAELVLRRPPPGPLLPTAHDVVREHRVLTLLRESSASVRVPISRAVCVGDDVIGSPFYVMDRAPGVVVRGRLPRGLAESPQQQRDLGLDLAVALAEVHSVDWRPFVDAGIGRLGGYLERQLRRWVGQREGVQAAVAASGGTARELPDYDAVRDWLIARLPEEAAPALVHGDYKLDNVVVQDVGGSPRISAVIDWEMATVGDPRADLGYLLSFWLEPGESMPLAELVTTAEHFPTRAELVAAWEARTGRAAGDTRWFVTLAIWKLAILLEASYHRWLAGQADDPFFARLGDGVPSLLARAREVSGG
jgi:aminoglycoside phosphotransferase (APT) family kinase protein